MRALYPVCQVAELAAGYRDTTRLMQRALVTMVTAHREPMRTFSQQVLQMEPQMYRGHSVACPLEDGTLALWRQSACAAYRRALARGVANDRVLMALEVADVEREDARLTGFQVEWVQELTTQPWEHRAFYGRDPDGNVLNVPTAVAEQHHCVRMRVGWGSRSEQPFMAHVRLNVVHSCKLWRLFTCWILQQLYGY